MSGNNKAYKQENHQNSKEVMMMRGYSVPEAFDFLVDDQLALKSLLLIGKHAARKLSDVEADLDIPYEDADRATKFLLHLGLIRYNPHKQPNPTFRLTEKGFLFLTQFKAVNKQAREYLGDKAQFIITR